MPLDHSARLALYEKGLDDTQIARVEGVTKGTIYHWRRNHGLMSNSTVSAEAKATLSRGRRFLYDLNWGDDSIAWQQGVDKATVRQWRARYGLPANRPRTRTYKRDKLNQLQRLQARVVRAIGARLPQDIAADAAAELMMAVVDGTVAINDIEKVARKYGNRALEEYANAFLSRSLDEPIEGRDGVRPIEMLRDESADVWLDEMGASWH
jgi:hypothetical protein